MIKTEPNSNFLQTTDIFKGLIDNVVKPQYVTGFVYSFFSNPVFPLEPLYLQEGVLKYIPRPTELYNTETKEITVAREEAVYINNKLFDQNLYKSYSQLFSALDILHRHLKDAVDPDNLIEFYTACLISLDNGNGNYHLSRFSSVNDLNINYFKNQTVIQLHNLKEAIKEKIGSLQKTAEEVFPSKYFTKAEYYHKFKKYQTKYIENPYNDYSFLFKKMMEMDMMHRVKFIDVIDWLVEEGYIDKETWEQLDEKGSFNTKANSKERLRNFKLVFENE